MTFVENSCITFCILRSRTPEFDDGYITITAFYEKFIKPANLK